MTTPPTSVGQLIVMTPDVRADRIRALSPEARVKLAHLASIGARECARRARDHIRKGREGWAAEAITDAAIRSEIAAELTAETKETD